MKCRATKEQLLPAILNTERTTGKNQTLPILACILLEVQGTTWRCTATNLEVGIRHEVLVHDTEDGKVAVRGSVLAQVIGSLPQGASVTLTAEGTHLLVESVSGSSRIAVQDVEEFPSLPVVQDGVRVELPQKALFDTLTSVSHCASTNTIKPELASVYVRAHNGTLTTVATDSFRLAEKKVALKKPVDAEPFLIPSRSVQDLLRVLEQTESPVELCVGEHQLSLEVGSLFLTLRLTAGTFPDYEQIIPKEFVTEATMLVADFEQALKRASIFSDKYNQVLVQMDPVSGKVTVHTENSAVGDTTDSVSATVTGEELATRFNQRYVQEAFGPIATDSFVFSFSGVSHPAIIRPVGDDSYRYLVMPMNR
jgi:DNA polymerase III subunit beta